MMLQKQLANELFGSIGIMVDWLLEGKKNSFNKLYNKRYKTLSATD